ncbi:uncharacterized protein LOC122403575 [Colletes gigas]|uniref:uncharacterized protein LOC122403575 n=1 Tax=Colletes gigas TaxID=935657 RepID=UPI001C9A6117|nr:uncharacterized protein LOC122403575 [Colletes gigas]
MKSRKVLRSPVRNGAGEDGALESLIRELREEMRKDLGEVRKQVREAQEELGKVRGKMEEWEERWRREREEIEDRMARLEEKMGEAVLKEEWIRKVEGRLKVMEAGGGMENEEGGGVGDLVREVAEAKTENRVWEIVNRGRKKRKGVDESIKKEEWKEHFMGLLGGVENRVRIGGEEGRRRGEEEGISKEEVKRVVRRLKEGKAMGWDEIPNEAWKYGGERGLELAWEVCRRVWDGEGWPQGWKEGIIVPLAKKGGGKREQEYRGVTLMPTLYKVVKRGGKLVALFVDLRAAFDTVDRRTLREAMEWRGAREGLRERVREIYMVTKSRVKVGGADVEEEMRKGRWGGVEVGGRRVCTLAYADDLVMVAKDEEEMGSMIRRFEGYLEGKRLEVNVEKTKVVRFRKGGGRERKVEWRWKGKRIEEVKEFKYLGYVFKRNGGQEAQVRDRVRKAGVVMRQAWGIGKRKFERDWGKRMWLFDALVWTVAGYGAEIWGWREREEMERMQERFLRWSLGVDWRTPGYMTLKGIPETAHGSGNWVRYIKGDKDQ